MGLLQVMSLLTDISCLTSGTGPAKDRMGGKRPILRCGNNPGPADQFPCAYPCRAAATEASRMSIASAKCASGMVIGARKRTTLP